MLKKYGSILRERKIAFKKDFEFDCKCPVCSGQVPFQEKTLKKLIKLEKKETNLKHINWKKEALIGAEIVKLTMELKIGGLSEKVLLGLAPLAVTAHLARDKDLLKKTMNKWKQLNKETKLDFLQRYHLNVDAALSRWSNEFTSGNAPEQKEVDFLFSRLTNPIIADVD